MPHAICIAAQSNALLLVISLWTCHCSHIHEYWKEHNRIASGVYNWMFDLDRQVQYSLETIPRDTIDLFRKKLMMEVRRYFEESGLTQVAAAKAMKTTQPRLNNVLKGKIEKCTIDRLVQMLAEVGWSVSIKVSKAA